MYVRACVCVFVYEPYVYFHGTVQNIDHLLLCQGAPWLLFIYSVTESMKNIETFDFLPIPTLYFKYPLIRGVIYNNLSPWI